MFRIALLASAICAAASGAWAQPVSSANAVIPQGTGLTVGNPAGGPQGPGVINAENILRNGQAIAGGLAVPNSPCVIGGNGTLLGTVTLGANLSCNGTTLNATGGASPGGTTGQVQINNGSGGLGALPTATTGAGVVLQTTSGGLVAPSVLPIATTSAAGAIVPDGTTITVNPSTGLASAVGGSATSITAGATTVGGASSGTLLATGSDGKLAAVTPTGTGNAVLATSPTLVTPALGTPSAAVLTNATGLPLASGVTGTLQAAQSPAYTGDMTKSAGSLTTVVGQIGGKAVTLGGALTTTGAFTLGLTVSANTSLTLPTSGTVTALGNAATGTGSIVMGTGAAIGTPAITGGTADNTVIGGTTPAAATHTTLAASGAVSFTGTGTALAVTNNATVGGTIGVTGTASVGGITQLAGSTLFRYTVGSGNYHTFFDGTGINLLEMGVGAISPQVPVKFLSAVTLSGASYVVSANAQLFTNTTVSGSPTFTTLQYALNSFQLTDNLTPTGGGSVASVAALSVATAGSANTARNLYTIDSTSNITVTPLTANVEAHAGRFTTNITANMGGTNNTTTAGGNAIGLKANATLSAAATFLNIVTGIEVQLGSASAPARQYGIYVQSSSTTQGALDDAAIGIFGNTGFVGYKTSLLFGSASSQNTPPTGTLGTGTLIGTANGGSAWTATNGVDFSHATFTGNTWNDGHVTISGAGLIALASGAGIQYAALPSGTAATYACFTSGGLLISSASPC